MHIFANHAHVFPRDVRQDGTIDCLRYLMEECGIEGCVAFAPFHRYCEDGRNVNTWLSEEIKNIPELYGFGVIDFTRNDIVAQVDEIYSYGFRGIKIHPAFQQISVIEDKALKVYARAEELGLMLSFHTGIHWHRIKDYQMLLFDEVAYHFPKLTITLEHVGGYCFFQEAVAVMLNNRTQPPHIFAGLTSVFDPAENKFWYLDPQKIKDLLWLTGSESCIFGLDFPYNGAEKVKQAIKTILDLDISEREKQNILGGNLKKLLQI